MTAGRLKIGQVARMIGISPETLRYYEQKGIIRPDKEQSKYRTYDMQDVCVLIRVRMYLQYGFSLEEARRMIYEEEETYTDRMLRSRIRELETEISSLMEIRRNMSGKHLELLDVMKNMGRYSIEERPAMELLEIMKDNEVVEKDEAQREYSRWVNHSLDSFPYIEYVRDQNNRLRQTAVGQGLFRLDRKEGNSDRLHSDYITFCPPCQCLHTGAVMYQSVDGNDVDSLNSVLEYMDSQKLLYDRKVFARTIYICGEKDRFKYFRDIWIPLKEQEKKNV